MNDSRRSAIAFDRDALAIRRIHPNAPAYGLLYSCASTTWNTHLVEDSYTTLEAAARRKAAVHKATGLNTIIVARVNDAEDDTAWRDQHGRTPADAIRDYTEHWTFDQMGAVP